MKKSLRFVFALAALPLLAGRDPAAQVIDGQLDSSYGVAKTTQTIQTKDADASRGLIDNSDGSELDGAYGFIADGVLHLFLSGNLLSWTSPIGPHSTWDNLEIFIDSRDGGQNTMRGDNAPVGYGGTMNRLAGLTFDAGFAADDWFGFRGPGLYGPGTLWTASYAELLTNGGGAGYELGQGAAGGPGTLSGGTNPNGVQVTIDNRNLAGVGLGCAPASGAGVTTGIEWAIPLAAIGNPIGCLKVSVLVDFNFALFWNQTLGPMPLGSCDYADIATVNFAALAGDQFFRVCPGFTPAIGSTWGRLKAIYR